jgi:hypothetical protein
MHGALQGYVFYGYKRIMQQAPYFAIPFGLGEFGLDEVRNSILSLTFL